LVQYGNPEILPIFSGFLGVALYTLAFVSISMAVSSFTENQIVAAISSMVILLLLFMVERLGGTQQGLWSSVVQYLSPYRQAATFVGGVISLKATVYFLSLITLGLFASQRALEAYRWR
jgi:ABC-2 type transport system permease protein